jgi:small-conductance mechanosensitive channel
MIEEFSAWWAHLWVQAVVIVVGSIVVALLSEVIICRGILVAVGKTRTEVDDQVVKALHRPIFWSVLLAGLAWATAVLTGGDPKQWHLPPGSRAMIYAGIRTAAVIIWALTAVRVGKILLGALSARPTAGIVQPRTLPAMDILLKVIVLGSASYFALLAWDINVSGWLASAGILGLVIGLAAKDTLANLFAGIFILADAPYKIGDFIVVDGTLRGEVTDIGIRSTRILTRDDVQITIPNAVIGNSKIVNETGGRHDKERVRIKVSVAYGSDIDKVREVLLACAAEGSYVCDEPAPRIRFRRFGDSGLDFELLVWVEMPKLRGRLTDELNERVYKAFAAASIEIPYPKRDVYIKQMPRG